MQEKQDLILVEYNGSKLIYQKERYLKKEVSRKDLFSMKPWKNKITR